MSYIFSRNFAGSSIPAPLPVAPPATEAQIQADQAAETALLAEERALKQQLDDQQEAERQILAQQNDEQRVVYESQIEEGRSSDNKLVQNAMVLAGVGLAGVVGLMVFKKIIKKIKGKSA